MLYDYFVKLNGQSDTTERSLTKVDGPIKLYPNVWNNLEPDHVISDQHNICYNLKMAYGCPFVQIGLEKLSICHSGMLILIKINMDLKI